MINWTQDDFKRTGLSTPAACLRWIREGLDDWRDPRMMYRAFTPIADLFDPNDDAEPQLARMFAAMVERDRCLFLDAIELGFSQAEPCESGYIFFDALQRIAGLIRRPEPIDSMVERVTAGSFLDPADPEVAEHLFAGCFVTLARVELPPGLTSAISKLLLSKHFDPEYAPYIVENIGKQYPERIFYYLHALASLHSLSAYPDRIHAAIATVASRLSAMGFLAAIQQTSFTAVNNAPAFDDLFYRGFDKNIQEVFDALWRVDRAVGAINEIDAQINAIYFGIPDFNRRLIAKKIERLRTASAAAIQAYILDTPLAAIAEAVQCRAMVGAR